jgi:hypothetical protein
MSKDRLAGRSFFIKSLLRYNICMMEPHIEKIWAAQKQYVVSVFIIVFVYAIFSWNFWPSPASLWVARLCSGALNQAAIEDQA